MELPQSNTLIPVYSYTRTELLSLRTKTSLLSLSTVDRLKDLNIGYHVVVVVDPLHQRAASRVQQTKSCGSQQSLPQVARKGSTLSGFVQRSRLEREVGRDLHSNKWEEV